MADISKCTIWSYLTYVQAHETIATFKRELAYVELLGSFLVPFGNPASHPKATTALVSVTID